MNERKRQILAALQEAPRTATGLAWRTNAPVASIRRSIQELRAAGENIQVQNSVYTWQAPETAPAETAAPVTTTELVAQ